MLEQLQFAEIRFIPSGQPPHRDRPGARTEQRLAMLQQAIAGQTGFVIDTCELERDGPSYMVDTLTSLRARWPQQPLCLLLGLDAFRDLHTWHRWHSLVDLAHILVLHRPGYQATHFDTELAELMQQHGCTDSSELSASTAGRICLQAVSQLAISATVIRRLVTQGLSPRYLVPEAVSDYIQTQNLYR